MRTKTMTGVCGALIAMAIGAPSAWAAKEAAPETPLTEAGQKLLERYTGMLTKLKAEISEAVPTVTFGFLSGDPAFWNGVALYRQRAIVAEAKAVALAAVGEDIGEANESKEKEVIEEVAMTDADRNIAVDRGGVITIPASAASKPTKSTGKIIFMGSNLGGKQLHYSRNGEHEDFEYAFDAPAAGKYALTARVVTPSWKQSLLLTVNDAKKPIEIALPFTVGMWDATEPVEIELVNGKNVFRFSRGGSTKGVTIKDFTLTPISDRVSQASTNR